MTQTRRQQLSILAILRDRDDARPREFVSVQDVATGIGLAAPATEPLVRALSEEGLLEMTGLLGRETLVRIAPRGRHAVDAASADPQSASDPVPLSRGTVPTHNLGLTHMRERGGADARAGRVFVVHGHDHGAKDAVALFLTRMGFDPVVLHEQASRGRTVIEKLDYYADVAFAVVVLTPDDVGGVASRPSDLQRRARQNVILELGLFIGRLGRERVCALVKGDLERPSDVDGVVYVAMDDAGAWHTGLTTEMESAGLPVDWGRLSPKGRV